MIDAIPPAESAPKAKAFKRLLPAIVPAVPNPVAPGQGERQPDSQASQDAWQSCAVEVPSRDQLPCLVVDLWEASVAEDAEAASNVSSLRSRWRRQDLGARAMGGG